MKRKLLFSLPFSIIGILLLGVTVLAAPGAVTNLTANPTPTKMSLSWTLATGSTSTMIRYLTTTYPTDPTGVADGSLAVSPTLITTNSYIQTGLTAGTTYYYSAWGFDGVNYGAVDNIVGTTTGTSSAGDNLPTPTLPSNMNQTPSSSTWYTNLQPFTGIIAYFAADWGVPKDNSMLAVSAFIMVVVGAIIYIRTRNFFIAYAFVIALDILSIGMHIMFGWSLYTLLALGLGVWALEHNFQ